MYWAVCFVAVHISLPNARSLCHGAHAWMQHADVGDFIFASSEDTISGCYILEIDIYVLSLIESISN